ncbi:MULTISPECIES: DNA polymerase III subunit alpha [Halomonadaceae]|jgi:DNA polymerase III subunit alpha|uniref:DNA polymerase III subunit alpha n=1 Tax=Halomonadaceae TaxID=28256 RepID=UPI00110EA10A|nr:MULTISPECIES: DNA polymerase III subunit alpha [Halomonas]TMU23707.1 DNA polymerase III subunit alpha [Halomonas sp. ATBC28]CAD5249654.1 DNA polymerase III alpha subunit [Halomonas sp. I3]CAD5272077.1 DNA polymerase III alpha subunit [Halomonas sp. 113]CAD5273804.1 DNA polymerase III alpha subunit [Halomonas sp. 59]CAD5279813.1 DNA polymerase III alpha subunit [Halomonas sp. 156]
MTVPFVHLRLHSEYSLVDGLVKLKSLVSTTAERAMPALALTDETNLFGLVKFYKAAQGAGLKPIIGSDLWLHNPHDESHPYRLTLLAMNDIGYRNLTELISKGWTHGQRQGRAILDKQWVLEQSEGLIALSGAREGEIGRHLLSDHEQDARVLLEEWQAAFPERFYLELIRTGRPLEEACVHASVKLAIETGTPVVATNDVRFLEREDYWAHETRVAIGEGKALDDPRRERRYTEEQYLKSPDEMAALFADIPEALENSVMIAERCSVDVRLGEIFLPEFGIPEGMTQDEFFRKVSHDGLTERLDFLFPAERYPRDSEEYQAIDQRYRDRLEFELNVIIQMGFPGYFLIVMDFIQWAKDNRVPVGPGRGSGAGSLVAYAQKITDLDPIGYDLLFERFLNPERVSMPDFDVDFCMEKRDKVIEYVAERYGRNAVSQIVTFGTMAAKAVVRDVARAQGRPYSLGDKLSKLIPFEVGMTLAKAIEQEPALKEFIGNDEEAEEIWEMALKLEGTTRGTGKHAGGVVIAPTKLTDFSPLLCDEDGSGLVVQFDKNDIEEAGLVKFDFLGLRTLTIIDWALEMVDKVRSVNGQDPLNIDSIPLDDAPTFEMLKRAETTAVFQLESRGMKELIKRLLPDSLDDMIALVALFRPGPLQSGMVDDFINRKHGRAEVSYPHPDYQHELLKPVLAPTYGIILYQEQVMQIAQVMAGYSLGQADMLRRAMGKKKPEEMAKQRDGFMEGCAANGIDKDLAGNIFDLVEKFAGYGFNKSHSAAYALVSYQTAWLKAHYPGPFMAAVMSTEMDNLDKVVPLIEECRNLKLTVTPPNVNVGGYKFTVDTDARVVYGLGAIRGVGEGPIGAIVEAREADGPFKDIFDFCRRIDPKRMNKRTLEALIRSGALDTLGPNRAVLFAAMEDALKAAAQNHANQNLGMLDMFGDAFAAADESDGDSNVYAEYINAREWTDRERLSGEKDTLGLYLTGHPIDEYERELKRFVSTRISDLKPSRDPQRVAGLVVGVRTMKSKRGDTMAFITLDDRTGRIEASLFGELFEQLRGQIEADQVLIVEGEVSSDEYSGGLRLRGKDVTPMVTARIRYGQAVELALDAGQINGRLIETLRDSLTPYRDQEGLPVRLQYRHPAAVAWLELADEWKVAPSDDLLLALQDVQGQTGVQLRYR